MLSFVDTVLDRRQCLRSNAVSTFADIVFDRSVEGSVVSSVEGHRLSTIIDTVYDRRQCLRSKTVSTLSDIVWSYIRMPTHVWRMYGARMAQVRRRYGAGTAPVGRRYAACMPQVSIRKVYCRFLHVSCDLNHFEQKTFSIFTKFPIEKNRLSYFAYKFPIGGNRLSYFASKFPIEGNRLSYFAYGSHDMRSCYRSTASETVTPNRVTVTRHRSPIGNRGPKIFKMIKISKFF